MGRIIKTVSLDQHTASVADDMPNFSAWVRGQLNAHQEAVSTKPCAFFQGVEICNGMKSPRCLLCYPDGPPSQKMWKEFIHHKNYFRTETVFDWSVPNKEAESGFGNWVEKSNPCPDLLRAAIKQEMLYQYNPDPSPRNPLKTPSKWAKFKGRISKWLS